MTNRDSGAATPLCCNLLTDRLLDYREGGSGECKAVTLPELFIAMQKDDVRDFPALRPHQRHPWHAFLVQLAAITLNRANRQEPFPTAHEWHAALLALTPNDADGAAWSLISPANRPAFMQAPEPRGSVSEWKSICDYPDALDMLVTSKNHDLKAGQMANCTAQDWIYALVSLQTQEGFLGAGNYGVSRMNGGSANRCGIGLDPSGRWGKRWGRDLKILLTSRAQMIEQYGFDADDPLALLWLPPWNGEDSLPLRRLDPWYIEICRRVRLVMHDRIKARLTGSKVPRIDAKELNGVTGDPWMPIDVAGSKALTIGARGFDYKLSVQLLFGKKYSKCVAQAWQPSDDTDGVTLVARGVARGQGKTDGYHERHIPVTRTVRKALIARQADEIAKLANERIDAIDAVRKMLWNALTALFDNGGQNPNGTSNDVSITIKDRADIFAAPFETECDTKFFAEFAEEIETNDRDAVREEWLRNLASRAERVLRAAFVAGPRHGLLRYRAQAVALNRLYGAMRGSKLPAMSIALKSATSEGVKP